MKTTRLFIKTKGKPFGLPFFCQFRYPVCGKTGNLARQLGRLIRENNPHEGIDKTTTWCYDSSGNILSRTGYAYTTGTLGTPTAH